MITDYKWDCIGLNSVAVEQRVSTCLQQFHRRDNKKLEDEVKVWPDGGWFVSPGGRRQQETDGRGSHPTGLSFSSLVLLVFNLCDDAFKVVCVSALGCFMPKRFLFCDDNHFPFSTMRIFENAARGGRVTLLTLPLHSRLEVLAQ